MRGVVIAWLPAVNDTNAKNNGSIIRVIELINIVNNLVNEKK